MRLRISAGTQAGGLHVGNARIALLSWLLARRHGGHVTLRASAPRPGQPIPQATPLADLAWLGLDWNTESHGADREPLYADAIARLQQAGRLYPCFESEEELNSKRDARQRRREPTLYDRAMLRLTPEQRQAAEAGGKRPHWRFLLSGTPAEWGDMVLGRQTVKLSAISDPVLVAADGTPHPLLTEVVDDLDAGITHVLSGEDRLTATAIQLELRAALGAPTTRAGALRLAHVPLLADAKGGRLKRTGSLSLRGLRADGIEPAALAGFLARLGTPDPPAAATPAALAPTFDLSRLGKAQPRLDPQALLALNRRTLATLPFEAVQDRLPASATPAFWQAVRGSLDLLGEARGWWDVVCGSIVPPLVEEAEFLRQASDLLPPEPWDAATWSTWTDALRTASGRKGDPLLLPLRLALTGEDQGPDLHHLLPLMGRTRVAERLRLAAA